MQNNSIRTGNNKKVIKIIAKQNVSLSKKIFALRMIHLSCIYKFINENKWSNSTLSADGGLPCNNDNNEKNLQKKQQQS